MIQQAIQFDNETNNQDWIVLDVTPRTSPRPRFSSLGHAYMPPEYVAYQKILMFEMKKHSIIPKDYEEIELIAFFPYPKSTPKKKLIEGSPMRVKPDYDNTAKTITDCLEKLGIISNDSQIWKAKIEKRYTIKGKGRIEFKLK